MRFPGLIALSAAALMAAHMVSPLAMAQDAEDGAGTVIQVGPDAGVSVDVNVDGDRARALRERRRERRLSRPGFAEDAPVAVSRYWIGVGGGPLPPALRAQVNVDPEEGVLIQTVAPDGPAAEAGIEKFDIVLRANGKPVNELRQLADVVGEQGEMKGQIALDLLRGGKVKTLFVKPVERPVDAVIPGQPRERRFGRLFGPEGALGGEGLEGLGEMFGGEVFGPEGLQLGNEAFGGFAEMIPELAAGGISVSVQRQNDGPAKVTVKQGDKIWEFDEGDEAAMNALPADVLPMVERMLNQNGRAVGQDFEGFGFGGPGFQMQFGGDELAGRIRALQERMLQMQGGFGGGIDPGAVAPDIQLDEAPAFDNAAPADEVEPEVADEPIEIEIPGE